MSGIPQSDFFPLLTLTLLSVLIFCYIYGGRGVEYRHLIFVGFLLRVVMLLGDYYGWLNVHESGLDSEAFDMIARENVSSFIFTSKTNYTSFLTLIYSLSNSSRLVAQSVNLFFGMGVVFTLQRAMQELDVSRFNLFIATCVLLFLPNLNALSVVLLREAWVQFFIALSLLYFVRWCRWGGGVRIVVCAGSLLVASYMHAGVIGMLIGYCIAFVTYDTRRGRITPFKMGVGSVVVVIFTLCIATLYRDMFVEKFVNYDSLDDIVDVTNRVRVGGSDYLLWINSQSITQSLLFAPIKMFYFLFSPLPTEWRGLRDVVAFFADAAVYMALCLSACIYSATSELGRSIKKYLVVTLCIVVFIFAYGTGNAGTAMRHRAKVLPIVVLIFAVSSVNNKKEIL